MDGRDQDVEQGGQEGSTTQEEEREFVFELRESFLEESICQGESMLVELACMFEYACTDTRIPSRSGVHERGSGLGVG